MDTDNLSNLKKHFRSVGAVLLFAATVTLFIILARTSHMYLWFVVAPVLGVVLYLLAPPSSKLSAVFKPLFPVANELIRRQEEVESNISVVEKMAYTLRFYELPDIDQENGFRAGLINSLPRQNTESARVNNCAALIVTQLKKSGWQVAQNVLILLYQDLHQAPPIVLWEKEKPNLVPGVAALLSRSKHLRASQNDGAYRPEEIQRLLQPLPTFTLNRIKDEAARLTEFWQATNSYLSFLADHGVTHNLNIENPGTVLNYISDERLPLARGQTAQVVRDILHTVGTQAIASAFPKLAKKKPELEAIWRISLILFLEHFRRLGSNEDEALRVDTCREAADDDVAIRMAFAYLEFKEDLHTQPDLDGKRFVSIAYLVRHWAAKVKEKKTSLAEGFDKEIETIRGTLSAGNWVTSLAYMIQQTLEKLKTIEDRVVKLAAERPFVQQSLRRIFKNLRFETVERYLEARTINAYLITFRTPLGSVAKLLKCLVADTKQEELRKLGVATRTGDSRKYNYHQYTTSSRIGIVPKGLSFEEFQNMFQADFEKVVEHRRILVPHPSLKAKIKPKPLDDIFWDWNKSDLEDIELIVHRFGLSGRNYFGFVSSGITKEHAIEKIRELFAGILTAEDLHALIKYEKDEIGIVDAVMEGPIAELVSDVFLPSPEEVKILNRLDEKIRTTIFMAFRCRNARELGQCLIEGNPQTLERQSQAAVKEIVTLLSGAALEFDKEKCLKLTGDYLMTIKALAGIAR